MKRKEFERIRGTGAVKSLPSSLWSVRDSGENGLLMCPYTNYIPLSYLFLANNGDCTFNKEDSFLKSKHRITKAKNKLFNGGMFDFADKALISRYIKSSDSSLHLDVLKSTFSNVNQYLFFDSPVCPTNQIDENKNRRWRLNREQIIKDASTIGQRFNQRSFSGYVSPYSLYRNDGPKYIPHMLAVVRPEHYMWLKLNYLLTGAFDMSKIVILIDNQLDTTLFPVAGFKSLYKQIKPQILETSAQIWRVPLEFIQENCFLPKFELKEKNIFKRKQEQERIIEELYKSDNSTAEKAEQWASVVLDGIHTGGAGIMGQLRTAPVTYTYNPTTFTSTDITYTINTGAGGFDGQIGISESTLSIEEEPAVTFGEYDPDFSNDGPERDGMDGEGEWEDGDEDIFLERRREEEGLVEDLPELPL